MVSQLLLGECVHVLQETQDFTEVQSLYDGYTGWCQRTQLTAVSQPFANNNHRLFTTAPFTHAQFNGQPMVLPAGCFVGCTTNGVLQLDDDNALHFNPDFNPAASLAASRLQELTQPYLNTAYLWGGKSIFGIDCSGFVQQVYKLLGIALPRDAYQQAATGEAIGFLEEARPGDLAFFDNDEGRITHVGILQNSHTIIHASGRVRIDGIDNMGIVHAQTKQRTHQLRTLRRVLP
jgi:cell wall-associated NlpC family hydrolase